MTTNKIIFAFFVFSFFTFTCCKEECHTYEKDGFKHLGTKTPYRIISNKKDSPLKFEGCTPAKIIGVLRHGTRTPGVKVVREIKDKLGRITSLLPNYNISSELCENEEKNLEKWALNLENDGEKYLTHEGEDEMIDLAERYQNRFPSLLNREYDNNTFLFRFTDTQRTRESAKYFTVGLFGKKESKHVWFPQPIPKDPILRFYKLCERWLKDVKKNPESKRELEEFKTTDEVRKTCSRISERLGLNYTLDFDDVHLIYVTCSFETAWKKYKKSPWCSVFSKKDFKIMEYAEELKYYWRDGYGFDINYKQACPLMENIFTEFEKENNFTSIFYFTHSGTLLKLISHLGLYKDNYKLTHETETKIRDKRRWRVSFIDSFSTNVVFVLYKCQDEPKILTLHQERIVKVPGCPSKDLCPLSLIKHNLVDSIDHCDFNNMCSLK